MVIVRQIRKSRGERVCSWRTRKYWNTYGWDFRKTAVDELGNDFFSFAESSRHRGWKALPNSALLGWLVWSYQFFPFFRYTLASAPKRVTNELLSIYTSRKNKMLQVYILLILFSYLWPLKTTWMWHRYHHHLLLWSSLLSRHNSQSSRWKRERLIILS